MSGTAAYAKKLKVSTNQSTWYDVATTSPSLDLAGEVLDDTDLASNAGFRSKVLGLHDWSVSGDANWAASNNALGAIRTAKLNRSALYIQYLPDGTVGNGFQGEVVVESFNMSGEVGGLETVSFTLQGKGALGAAS